MIHTRTPVKKSKMHQKLRQQVMERQWNILLYVTMFCVFGHALLEAVGISIALPSIIDRLMTVGGFGTAFLLMNRKDVGKSIRKSPCVYVLMAYLGMCVLMTISSFVNKDTVPVYNPVTYNLMYQLYIFEALCLVLYAAATGKTMVVFDFWYYLLLGTVLLNDIVMFSGVLHFSDGLFETYLIGTKFDVVYMHMNLMVTYYTRIKLLRPGSRNAKLPMPILLTFLAVNVLISLHVDCNTGMLGSLMVTAIIWFFDGRENQCRKSLFSVRFFILICFISMMFAYYIFWLIRQPLVIYIVVNKLGRSLTLTGRTDIYELYPSVMNGNWMWGFGMGNSSPLCYSYFGYADVQNAILQWVFEVGVPGTVLLLAFLCTIIAVCRRKKSVAVLIPIAALIYVYLLLGTVEITMNRTFYVLMIIMLLLSVNDQLPNKRLGISVSPDPPKEKTGKEHEN